MQPQKSQKRPVKHSYSPFLGVVLNNTMALILCGLLGLAFVYTQSLNRYVKENLAVRLYVKPGLSPAQLSSLQQKLSEQTFVARAADTARVAFVSKEAALASMEAQTGEPVREILRENPLPDAFILYLQAEAYDSTQLVPLKAQLESFEGVSQVVLEAQYVQDINQNFRRIGAILLLFAVFFFVATLLLLDAAVRLSLYAQRFKIRTMQLVGALPAFIKKPYLQNAVIQGGISALAACVVLSLAHIFAGVWLEELQEQVGFASLLLLFALLAVFGVGMSLASTFWVLEKYLKRSLEELY